MGAPTQRQIESVIEDFFGGAGTITWKGKCCTIELPGQPSHPYRSLRKDIDLNEVVAHEDGRWIEVFVDPKYLDVITRMQDRFTGCLADQLARTFAHWWEARLEDSVEIIDFTRS